MSDDVTSSFTSTYQEATAFTSTDTSTDETETTMDYNATLMLDMTTTSVDVTELFNTTVAEVDVNTTITDDIPTYITEAPTPQITKLDNGVIVASLFNAE